ncbi:uncharacterized protein LOC123401750 [Hordeum vulgare subsp. vulgare]|uniref:Predicted protein n=1 Tax=Hordeum vulgare subsp. vulgare TaxID=112509 RepID=F2E6W8_HORVV|nr:uncharacterized protein LOC123401750 [Hordeum vulgare subsp. vulgare]KAI4983469.1 hypothetical protein ZWY2020_023961 [Hordeum vulgare]BAK03090.1 predicted protein [Hordeum vulgare subsp. vulgare]
MDPSQMMPRSFPMWPPPPPPAASDAMPPPPLPQPFLAPPPPQPQPQPQPNRGWKRKNNPNNNLAGGGAYQPPAIGDLQVQNRAKARRWFNNNNNSSNPGGGNNPNSGRKYFFPKSNKAAGSKAKAPRNTTSFIIRAKRAGGIASLVSPCPVTPAVLPTPRISPSREGLSDMAQQQWGVDGYGSMKGLIRLRASSPRHPGEGDAEGDDDSSSGSDVEEHVEVERRLDHDLSRFEMVYPGGMGNGGYVFEDLDDEYDQDVHVARLEEENLTLKERLFLMEQEVGDMRRRLEAIEARFAGADGAAAGSADNAALVLQQRGNADAENAVVENGVDAAAVAGDIVIQSLEDANANAAGAENANVIEEEKVDAASASDDTVEDALKNDTEMDVAASASAKAVADPLKNDTEMDVAASASAKAVADPLKNDTEMDVAASASANAVEDALKNDTEMGDATADAGNLVEEAVINVKEVDTIVPGANNAAEESLGKDDMNRGDVEQERGAVAGSEKNAEMADTGNGKDKGEDGKQA